MPDALLPLAHHAVVESLAFFVPVVVIVAVLLVTLVRDRRSEPR
ncbi:MAG TPA: hypothetical protein VF517_09105 [Thermoleophilaceae bacterium]|jgi:hypothetical protein